MTIARPASLGANVELDDGATGDHLSQFLVWAGRGQVSLGAVVQQTANKFAARLASDQLQNFQDDGSLPGAEIGFVQGQGELYEATSTEWTYQGKPVGVLIYVVAAEERGTWASVLGVVSVMGGGHGLPVSPAGAGFDAIVAHWQWPGEA